jgi:hypothetical protein
MTWRAALVVVMLSAAAARAAPHELGDADHRRLGRGETVVHERAVAGYPWPEMTAYRHSRASPVAFMAVYADFGAHAQYLPGVVTSRVLGREGPGAARVFYEHAVTGPNEVYTMIVKVTREGDAWQARSTLVTARYARRLENAVRVEPRGGGSLLIYSTLVDPGTLGATFGTPATVAAQLSRSVEALAARGERLAVSEPGRLATLVDQLEALTR